MNEDSRRIVGPGFFKKVYEAVRRIPPGHVSTYGDIAKRLGNVRIARHVGWALSALNDTHAEVPWHRVINAKGRISAPVGSHQMLAQTLALEGEGVTVSASGAIDLNLFRWQPPKDDRA